MPQNFIEQLLALASGPRTYQKGTYLFHQSDPVKSLYIVEDGLVELMRHQSGGQCVILHRITRQSILAEASIYSKTYHCDAVAGAQTRIYELPKKKFLEHIHSSDILADLWAEYLAHQVQFARQMAEILSRKTVAERLEGWLAWRDDPLPPKGQWKHIAAQIGVSPEALYRELSKRKKR